MIFEVISYKYYNVICGLNRLPSEYSIGRHSVFINTCLSDINMDLKGNSLLSYAGCMIL